MIMFVPSNEFVEICSSYTYHFKSLSSRALYQFGLFYVFWQGVPSAPSIQSRCGGSGPNALRTLFI